MGTNTRRKWIESTEIKPSRSVYALNLMSSMRLPSFKYGGGDNAQWISITWWPRRQVQRELCGTIFSGNVENLLVLCCNGYNDPVAWALFVKHPRVQGERLRQNHRIARVLTASFAVSPRLLHKQHPRSPGHYPLKTCKKPRFSLCVCIPAIQSPYPASDTLSLCFKI